MSQSLPTKADYKSILNNPSDYEKGCILGVDLENKKMHDMHNDYPLAPESIEVQNEWFSPYQKELLGDSKLSKIKKLVPNLRDKTKYIVHYRNLKLYLSLGMRLKNTPHFSF